MKINRDVGVIESVTITTPMWVDAIFEGRNDDAVSLLANQLGFSHKDARTIVNGFTREIVYARKVSDG